MSDSFSLNIPNDVEIIEAYDKEIGLTDYVIKLEIEFNDSNFQVFKEEVLLLNNEEFRLRKDKAFYYVNSINTRVNKSLILDTIRRTAVLEVSKY